MITNGIFSLLRGDDGLSAIIGGRIFPVMLPEGEQLPAMTYQVISSVGSPTLTTSGLQKMRIQFDCFADKDSGGYLAATNARNALRALLNGYRGELSDGTFLQNADMVQSTDYLEEYPRQFRCMAEFYLYFTFAD